MRNRRDEDEGQVVATGDAGGRTTFPRRWSGERIARFAFLAGQGLTAKRIAADPLVRSTEGTVYRTAHRYGSGCRTRLWTGSRYACHRRLLPSSSMPAPTPA